MVGSRTPLRPQTQAGGFLIEPTTVKTFRRKRCFLGEASCDRLNHLPHQLLQESWWGPTSFFAAP